MRTHRISAIFLLLVVLGGFFPALAGDSSYVLEHRPLPWWHIFGRPARDNPTAQLAYADKKNEDGKLRRAARQYRALVKVWPDAPEAPVAQYSLAQLLQKRKKPFAAFDEYKYLMSRYPEFCPYDEVLQNLFDMGLRVMNMRKARFFIFPGFHAPERAIPIFEEVVRSGPNWKHSPEAQFLIGQAYDATKQYELSIVAYGTCQYCYPSSPYAEKASFAKAYDLYLLAREAPNDSNLAAMAWSAFTFFIKAFPASDRLGEAKCYQDELYRRRAKSAYEIGRFYDKISHKPKAAIVTYQDFIKQFPHSEWTSVAESRIKKLQLQMEQKENENKKSDNS